MLDSGGNDGSQGAAAANYWYNRDQAPSFSKILFSFSSRVAAVNGFTT